MSHFLTRQLLLFAIAGASSVAVAADIQLTFQSVRLSDATSVVISDSSGHVVRTLRSNLHNKKKQGGTISLSWDAKDDGGSALPSGSYTATLVANSLSYIWQGTIGNTSRDSPTGGTHVYRTLSPITQMASDNFGNVFFAAGYNESGLMFHRFPASTPQVPSDFGFSDVNRSFTFVDSDGFRTYFANVGAFFNTGCTGWQDGNETFVAATLVNESNTQYDWMGNAPVAQPSGGTHGSWLAVDIEANNTDCVVHDGKFTGTDILQNPLRWRKAPNGGLAVQRIGRALLVAHTDENEVHVLDKLTGLQTASIPIPAPSSICTAADDSIWILSKAVGENLSTLARYELSGTGWAIKPPQLQIDGVPLSIGCNRTDGSIAVIDGLAMQVKFFAANGASLGVLGELGGYGNVDPTVRPTKFGFLPNLSFITFLPDGSFWVGDPINNRVLQYDSARNFVQQIAFLPINYKAAVHGNDPTRVYSQFLEYQVNYAQPIQNSWTLLRNWKSGLAPAFPGPSKYVPDGGSVTAGIQQPYRLSNGRTYASVYNIQTQQKDVVELNPQTGIRTTKVSLPINMQMYSGGSLRFGAGSTIPPYNCINPCIVYEQTLKGFDSDNDPIWNTPVAIAQMSANGASDPIHTGDGLMATMNEAYFPETSGNLIVSFKPGVVGGFHLGAIPRNGNNWVWKASPSGPFNVANDDTGLLQITDPKDGHFEVSGLPLQYAGGIVAALDTNIIYSYVGEGWNQGQANQLMHFDQSGAMLGQFGRVGYAVLAEQTAIPGTAGNAYSMSMASSLGKLYVYTNDEASNGGINRWLIDGTNTITRQSITVLIP